MAMTAYVTTLCRRPPPALSLAHGLAQSLDSLSSHYITTIPKKNIISRREYVSPQVRMCCWRTACFAGASSLLVPELSRLPARLVYARLSLCVAFAASAPTVVGNFVHRDRFDFWKKDEKCAWEKQSKYKSISSKPLRGFCLNMPM